MKNFNAILFIAIAMLLPGGKTFGANYQYKKYWQQSDLVKADAKSSFKVLQKENLTLPGIITSAVTVTKNNKESITKVLNVLKKSFKIQKWAIEKVDGLDLYEAIHKPTATIYRLIVNTKTNEFFIATVKSRFLMPSYLEAHEWQVEA